MKSINNCENPSSNPLQEAFSGFPIAAWSQVKYGVWISKVYLDSICTAVPLLLSQDRRHLLVSSFAWYFKNCFKSRLWFLNCSEIRLWMYTLNVSAFWCKSFLLALFHLVAKLFLFANQWYKTVQLTNDNKKLSITFYNKVRCFPSF
jgi:hypothetical protein